ncbi:MAG: bacteriohemerythrin [Rhodospirillales bacterium]|jgi:hemerythrin-like metal-binding protein/PAS domain S-box-containing protein|nr:bacteriohemerythrin [Rhodospirillales bacterium]
MSSFTVLFRVMLIVFVTEAIIMLGLTIVAPVSSNTMIAVDIVLLAALATPLIFFYAIKPYADERIRENNKHLKIEQEYAGIEKRSRLWLEHSPVCSKIIDLDYNLQYMSMAGISGLGLDDVRKFYGTPYPFDFFPQPFKDEMIASLDEARKTGEIVELEEPVINLIGEEIWFHSSIVPVMGDKGEVEYFLVVSSNTTERVRAEEKLRLSTDEAEKSSRAKSEFLASMSHELRTPMNAVLGFAQMLQYDTSNSLSPAQYEHVNHILEGGNHLLDLINEVLDLAKIESDHISLALDDIGSNEIVADAVSMAVSFGKNRGITIVDQFSAGPSVMLQTDQVRFKQCLLNFLSNAVKYNKDGGTVTVAGRITDDGFLRLSVKDSGSGIAKKNYPGVFQMFHRLSSDATVAKEGTGIGLTVTKLLVERMAGRIGFDSEVDIGSTFWLELPLASNENVLIWSEAMKIGVDVIDKDHQTLVSLVNQIMNPSINTAELNSVVDELIEHTSNHFRREEAVMEVCCDPGLDKHLEHHQELLAQVTDHVEKWRSDNCPEVLAQLCNFLRNWLFHHIMKEDAKIASYTQGKGQTIRKALSTLEA